MNLLLSQDVKNYTKTNKNICLHFVQIAFQSWVSGDDYPMSRQMFSLLDFNNVNQLT